MDDMMFVCGVSHLVLFFKHFERMRLLIGHIIALQTVDVPDGHEVDEDVDEDIDEDGLVICFVAMLATSSSLSLQTIVPSYFGLVNLTLEGRIW